RTTMATWWQASIGGFIAAPESRSATRAHPGHRARVIYPPMAHRPPPRPFGALRVLDLSTEIAGPYATKLLCDQGADVLKVEEQPGDPLRRRTAARVELPEGEDSALFRFLNAGKRAALCNFCDTAQRARLREL